MKTKYFFLALVCIAISTCSALAQGTTAFVYQGQLRDHGTNANGNYTMMLKLYDAAGGGNQIGNTITTSATFLNGIFSVNLDFGANAFDGTGRWLDIVIQSGTNAPETLSPRVQLLPTPYSIFAANAGSLASGTWSATAGTFQGYSNVFGISANNSLVLGLSTNGVLVNGKLSADGFSIGNNISIDDDGNGGLDLNTGNSNANLRINNLTLSGDTIQFPAQSGANITVKDDGDFMFDSNIVISALGVLTLPAPGGSLSIGANNQGITVNGVNLSAANGVVLPTSGGGNVSIKTSGNNVYIPQGGFIVDHNIVCASLASSGNVSAQSFTTTSDRNLKEQFTSIDSRKILERVASLPISSWNFKQEANTRHIGPMAQDFYAAFNVGTDDKHIATVDEDGVALAAIQGLNDKLKEKDAQIEAMEKRLAALEKMMKSENKQADK